MYYLDGKYYIIGMHECKECEDEELIALYRQYVELADNTEFRDLDVRDMRRNDRDAIAEAFKAVWDFCCVPVEHSHMTSEKHSLRERLEERFGTEIDRQIDQWLKVSLHRVYLRI